MRGNEKGFSLIETLASLVIISILLITFSQIFVSNGKAANRNTDKLLVVNLADSYLDRLKIEKVSYTDALNKTYPNYEINGRIYEINIKPTQNFPDLMFYNVVVTVTSQQHSSKGVVEGIVKYK